MQNRDSLCNYHIIIADPHYCLIDWHHQLINNPHTSLHKKNQCYIFITATQTGDSTLTSNFLLIRSNTYTTRSRSQGQIRQRSFNQVFVPYEEANHFFIIRQYFPVYLHLSLQCSECWLFPPLIKINTTLRTMMSVTDAIGSAFLYSTLYIQVHFGQ